MLCSLYSSHIDGKQIKIWRLIYEILFVCESAEYFYDIVFTFSFTFLLKIITCSLKQRNPFSLKAHRDNVSHTSLASKHLSITLMRWISSRIIVSMTGQAPAVPNNLRLKGLLERWHESFEFSFVYVKKSFSISYRSFENGMRNVPGNPPTAFSSSELFCVNQR